MSGTPTGARLRDVDALRGLALLGILMVNIWAFADPYYATSVPNPGRDGAVDAAIRFLVVLLFETKFYLLFSFLFGYSFTLQMDAAARSGARFRPRMVRRQLGLLVIGLAHGAVLYTGDILSTYALLGLALLLLAGWGQRAVLRLAGSLVGLTGLAWLAVGIAMVGSGVLWGIGPDTAALAKRAAFTAGPAATLEYHATHLVPTLVSVATLQAPSALAAFLIGLAAGRRRLLAPPVDAAAVAARHAAWWRLVRWCLPAGLAGAACYAWAAEFRPGAGLEMMGYGISVLTGPLLTAALVALALLAFSRPRCRSARDALATAGRVALSNYLLQSLLLNLLFTGYGLRWCGALPPVALPAAALVLFGAQLGVSRWWLRTHRYGPLEWLLRALTIGQRPPWRSPTASPEAAGAPAAGGQDGSSAAANPSIDNRWPTNSGSQSN